MIKGEVIYNSLVCFMLTYYFFHCIWYLLCRFNIDRWSMQNAPGCSQKGTIPRLCKEQWVWIWYVLSIQINLKFHTIHRHISYRHMLQKRYMGEWRCCNLLWFLEWLYSCVRSVKFVKVGSCGKLYMTHLATMIPFYCFFRVALLI